MASPAAVARLEAGAKGGTAGVHAYDEAAKNINGPRVAAAAALGTDAGFQQVTPALEHMLANRVNAPAKVALANLDRYGAAQGAANAAGNEGTSTYINEANAAIPVIDAEARLNEAQKEAMLAASTSRSSTATKGPTNAQIKTDLMGAAINQRLQRGASKQSEFDRWVAQQQALVNQQGQSAAQAADRPAVDLGMPGFGAQPPQFDKAGINTSLLGFAGSPASRAAQDRFVQPFTAKAATAAQPQVDARQAALDQLQNSLYGPGITQDAQRIGLAQGVDPNVLAGVLTPQVDAAYVAANKREGLYTPPSAVANQILPLDHAAQKLGFKPEVVDSAIKTRYYDWTGDHTLQSAFAKWLAQTAPTDEAKKTPQQQQADFEASPGANAFQRNVVQDAINAAHRQIPRGMDFRTFLSIITSDPSYKANQHSWDLALAMVQPLFDYAATHTRTSAPLG